MLYVLCAVFSLRLALAAESDLRPSNPSLETSAALAPARQGYRLFENVQLRSKTEIHFDPATRMVTIKMRINDPRGYFIPNLRPDNFLVYEDGVREDDTTVEVERLPVTLGILLEYGGRFSVMNTALGQDISMAAIELQAEIWRDDKVALWRYGDRIEELAGFSASHEKLLGALGTLGTPALSETDLYDALIDALARLKAMSGTKALLLVSSGVDTFSNHEFEEVRWAIRAADLPIYVINLDTVLEQDVLLDSEFARYDHNQLETSDRRPAGDRRAFRRTDVHPANCVWVICHL